MVIAKPAWTIITEQDPKPPAGKTGNPKTINKGDLTTSQSA